MDKKLLAFLIILSLIPLIAPAKAQTNLTILRDESHGQYYKSDSFSVLISNLQSSGVNVKPVSSNFLDEIKSADPKSTVVVIPNPEDGNFTVEEITAMKDFVEAGGVLILMSSVQYMTSSGPRTYGKPGTLNKVVFGIVPDSPVYFEGTDDNGNEIYDDVNNAGRPRQIKVSPNLIAPILRGGIDEPLVVTTSMVHVEDPKYVLAFTPSTSYAKALDGSIIAKGNIPRLAYIEHGDGKIILSGSTQTFTDKMISLSTSNSVLFANILTRATGVKISIEAVKTTLPIIDIVAIRLAMTVVVLYDERYKTVIDRKERMRLVLRSSIKYMFIVVVLFTILTGIEAAMMKAVFITTVYPGRSQPTSLQNVPLWANAMAKYFFALLVDGAIGIILGLIILRVEKVREYIVKYRSLLRAL